ncbi:hypothetical protein [Roseobacter sp. MH60115]|uniref:hypothetical protein n=1 Tax=Roseobacter sp. MH60115 TaxID=2785324 RepID=UPI0018A27D9B|nr:hypothetical protein [Roseobacter sp. MH60115]
MTQQHLQKLWTLFGTILVFYSVNTWLSSQGANAILNVKILDERPVIGALIAIPICSVLLFILARVGLQFAKGSHSRKWQNRMPLVWLEGLDTDSKAGKSYQAFFLLIFILIPIVSLMHFLRKVMSADVVNLADRSTVVSAWHMVDWELLMFGPYWNDAYRIGETITPNTASLENTVTWFPMIQPIILVALVVVSSGAALRFLLGIFN